MKTIAYCNPFVPVEWLVAHGLRPCWLEPRFVPGPAQANGRRGVCPFAAAVVDTVSAGAEAAAVVLTTACDQMRYAAALLDRQAHLPVFLLNVPTTWQTAGSGQLYVEELQRLGRFLVRLGGHSPTERELAAVMADYERRRETLRAARTRLSATQFAAALSGLRGGADGLPDGDASGASAAGVPLVILGGPLFGEELHLLDFIEQAGGRIVLDATEGGERTWPAPFQSGRLRENPLSELARAYFGAIPAVFRRPNDGLYEWLGRELAARQAHGIILRRYVWCDLWHAELARLRAWSPLPVLDIEASDEPAATRRTETRIEAFLETLT